MSARWEELTEGATAPERRVGPLTRTDFVRYQGASGDMNPVHHDETVRASGGVRGAARRRDVPRGRDGDLGMRLARARRTCARFKVRWKEPVWPGDVLTIAGRVARRTEIDGGRRVEVEIVCTRQTGGIAALATAVFVVL